MSEDYNKEQLLSFKESLNSGLKDFNTFKNTDLIFFIYFKNIEVNITNFYLEIFLLCHIFIGVDIVEYFMKKFFNIEMNFQDVIIDDNVISFYNKEDFQFVFKISIKDDYQKILKCIEILNQKFDELLQ